MSTSKLAPSISAHAFNWDRSMCAVCPNSNRVYVYSGCDNEDVSKWSLSYELSDEVSLAFIRIV